MATTAIIDNPDLRLLGKCEEVENGLIRCLRRGGPDFDSMAVYWIDSRGRIPNNKEDLLQYQKSLFGHKFYELPKTLQLNHYLFAVVENSAAKETGHFDRQRQLLESDLSYARKLLITEDGFKDYLGNLKRAFGGGSRPTVPVKTWERQLELAGLSGVFEEKAKRAHVIRGIENGRAGPAARKAKIAPAKSQKGGKKRGAERIPFIDTVQLTNFGAQPKVESVPLGAVTLLSGPNGVGKTSVLEAIEFALCGVNHRAPRKVKGSPEATVIFHGHKEPQRFGVTNQQRLELDAEWFGGYARRDSKLEFSFNRYVFFNSDSSFALQHSDDQVELEKSINRLALGEEASRVWERMAEYEKAFKQAHGHHQTQFHAFQQGERLTAKVVRDLEKPVKALPESFKRARLALVRLKSRRIPNKANDIDSEFLESIIALAESFQRIASLTAWIPDADMTAIANRVAMTTRDLKEIAKSSTRMSQLTDALEINEKAMKVAKERVSAWLRYRAYVLSNWWTLSKEVELLELRESEHAQLATLRKQLSAKAVVLNDDRALGLALKETEAELRNVNSQLRTVRATIERYRLSATEQQRMAAEIKSLARSLFEMNEHIRQCPVCASRFEKGDLRKRLEIEIDESPSGVVTLVKLQSDAQALANRGAELGRLAADLRILDTAAKYVHQDVRKSSIGKIATALQLRVEEGVRDSVRLTAVRASLRDLLSSGFSDSEFRDLTRRLELHEAKRGGASHLDYVESSVDREQVKFKKLSGELDALRLASAKTEGRLKKLRSVYRAGDVEARDFLKYVRELLSRAEEARDLLSGIGIHDVKVMKSDKVKDLVLRALVARDRVRDFVTVREQEEKRKDDLEKLRVQLAEERREMRSLKIIVDRVAKALDAIRSIQKDHSLDDLLDGFFNENLVRINAIFQMIHSPKDFVGVHLSRGGNNGRKIQLKRADDQLVDVAQVSSGQRAALAIAIFFALNEKLTVGPQLVLLDDPVVHIDDLNALAFFDYLREVAISKKRQIVYATADEKMARLFERKFEFMGKDFQQIPLSRAARSGAVKVS